MLILELGPRCNNACVFCAQAWERAEGSVNPNHEEIERALSNAVGQRVGIVGGEPTIAPELPSIVQRARASGAQEIILQTNGRRLAYSPYLRELISAGVSAFDISLQGSTAPMHDYHTSVPGSFAQTARGIRNACHSRLPVIVSTVVTRSNLRHLAEIAELAHALGARALRLRKVMRTGAGSDAFQRLTPQPSLAQAWVRSAVQAGERLGLPVLSGAHPSLPVVAFTGGAQGCEVEGVDGAHQQSLPRTRPARGEDRTSEARSGAALRDILPALFDEEGR